MRRSLIIFLILSVIFSLIIFSGCDNTTENDLPTQTPGTDINTPPKKDNAPDDNKVPDAPAPEESESKKATFEIGECVKILYNGEISEQLLKLQDALRSALGVKPVFITDSTETTIGELIIGYSERKLYQEAHSLLEKQPKEGSFNPRAGIYSDGVSAVLISDSCEGYDEYITDALIEGFIKEYIKESSVVNIENSVLISGRFDIIGYQKKLDETKTESEWKILEEKLGIPATNAFRDLYTMYSEKMLDWLACMYDPKAGGFYNSRSARDNEGFLPAIEPTYSVLEIIYHSGMIDSYGADIKKALPEWLSNSIIRFVKGLQDPNGYFYHPQYTKYQTDTHLAKRSRDLTRGLDILSRLGAKPTYNTPTGVLGDGISADGTPVSKVKLIYPLARSRISAVSEALAASEDTTFSSQLSSPEAFKKYLSGLNINFDPYTVGNELASMSAEIYARGDEYVKIIEKWLRDSCLDSTGHWYPENNYMGLNGLMKIAAAYNGLKIPLPYPERNANFAIDMMTTTEQEETVCFAYNAWFTVSTIELNLSRHQPNIADKINGRILNRLYENAPELIASMHKKQSQFLQDDGAFRYSLGGNDYTSMGLPAAVPNMKESNVGGTDLCTISTINHMFAALGLDHYDPPIYTKADFLYFIDKLEKAEPIVKIPEKYIKNEVTFDTLDEEDLPSYLKFGGTSSKTTYNILDDPRNTAENGGKIFAFNAKKDGTKHILTKYNQSDNPLHQVYVFEGEYCFTEVPVTNYFAYLDVGPECYMILFKGYSDGSSGPSPTHIRLFENSGGGENSIEMDLMVTIPIGEWFKIKVEYYIEDMLSPRIKLFVNDELITVTDNFYDKTGAKLDGNPVNPKNRYEGADFIVYSYYDAVVLMDNLKTYKLKTPYGPLSKDDIQPKRYNVDAPECDELIYDFDMYGESITSSGTDKISENGNISILLGDGKKSFMEFSAHIRGPMANCTVFEADLTLDGRSVGKGFNISFKNNALSKSPVITFNITVKELVSGTYGIIRNAPSSVLGDELLGGIIPIGEKVKLRIEYHETERITLFYINESVIATSDVTEINARKYISEICEISADNGAYTILDNIKFERIFKEFP